MGVRNTFRWDTLSNARPGVNLAPRVTLPMAEPLPRPHCESSLCKKDIELEQERVRMPKTICQLTMERDFLRDVFRRNGNILKSGTANAAPLMAKLFFEYDIEQ